MWNDDVAAVLVSPCLGVSPLTRTLTPLKEESAIVKFTAKDVYQVVNMALAFKHQLLKVLERDFSHCLASGPAPMPLALLLSLRIGVENCWTGLIHGNVVETGWVGH
jgi:hypothetical protein